MQAERTTRLFQEADQVFSTIVEELERFYLPLTSRDLTHIPEEERIGLLFTIENPFSRLPIPIGLAAERGFQDAARLLLRFCPFLIGRVSHARTYQIPKDCIFSNCASPRGTSRSANCRHHVKNSQHSRETSRFEICFSLFSKQFVTTNDFNPFAIGPVTFLPVPLFKTACLSRADKYFDQNNQIYQLLRDYCTTFSWIAKVDIKRLREMLHTRRQNALSCWRSMR